MTRKNTRVFIDVETTGLDPIKNGIIQLSGCVEQYGEVKQEFDFLVCPLATDAIDPKALKVTGNTVESIRKFETPETVHVKFKTLLNKYIDCYDSHDKAHFVAYNAQFDFGFVLNWFKKLKDKYFFSYFWAPPVCVMMLSSEHLSQVRHRMKNFQLFTVAAHLNIQEKGKAHDAITDIRVTRAIYLKVKAPDTAYSTVPPPLKKEELDKVDKTKHPDAW